MQKHTLLSLIVFSFILGCNQNSKDRDNYYQILDDTFIEIVDTIAYKYNSLRPAPNATILENRKSKYTIAIYNKFLNISKWKGRINTALNFDTLTNINGYKNLLLIDDDFHSIPLEINRIEKIGLYKLIPVNDSSVISGIENVGTLKFTRILTNGKIAMCVVTIQDNTKSGVEKLLLFSKLNAKWKIKKEIELGIW